VHADGTHVEADRHRGVQQQLSTVDAAVRDVLAAEN
jgi:hypothetical protein